MSDPGTGGSPPAQPRPTDNGHGPRRVRRRLPWLIPAGRTPTIAQLTVTLVILGVAWRTLRYLLAFPYWGDESFVVVSFLTRDFAGMIRPLEWGQIVPLGFMWADLVMARLFGVGEHALRFIPYVAGVASLILFWRLAAKHLPRRAALLAVGFLAASFYAVRHGAEAKAYSTDLFVALVLTHLAWAVWTHPRSALRWAALCLGGLLAPWCSYPALFVGGAVGILLTWLLVRERFAPGTLTGWLSFGLLFVGSSLTMIILYAIPHARAASGLTEIEMWRMAFPPWDRPWLLPVWLIVIHTGMMFAYPHGGHWGGSTFTFVVFIIGAIWMWRRNRALVVLLLAALPLNFIAASFEKYPYGGTVRTSLYLAPAICLLAGAGLYALLRRLLKGEQLRLGLLVASGAFAVLAVGGMIGDVVRPYATEHSIISYRHVREIAEATRPQDRWATFNAVEPCDYAPWLGHWRGIGGQWVFDMLRFCPTREPIQWAPPPSALEPPADGTLWLFCYRGIKVAFPEDQWQAYLDAVTSRLGSPEHESRRIKQRDGVWESIEIYRWDGRNQN